MYMADFQLYILCRLKPQVHKCNNLYVYLYNDIIHNYITFGFIITCENKFSLIKVTTDECTQNWYAGLGIHNIILSNFFCYCQFKS